MGSEKTAEVGVIIGRFQVPELHSAHRNLIEKVCEQHRKVLVLLGVAPVRVTRHNPLDFLTRELMVKKAFPRVVALPVRDMPDDRDWSRHIDDKIAEAVGEASAVLYGSRDSFIPHYVGRYPTIEMPESIKVTGTAMREAASREIRAERAFRTGVIYAVAQRYPTSYQCVDVVIWRRGPAGVEVLLGRKRTDLEGRWRFVGGFVQPEDASIEVAAAREAAEETGSMGLDQPRYAFSARVVDWRYRNEPDQIMTAVFTAKYLYGKEAAGDDLDAVRWWDAAAVTDAALVEEHRPLWPRVAERLAGIE